MTRTTERRIRGRMSMMTTRVASHWMSAGCSANAGFFRPRKCRLVGFPVSWHVM